MKRVPTVNAHSDHPTALAAAVDGAVIDDDLQVDRRPGAPARAWWAAQASLLALFLLCVAWEALIAPLRPGGSWLIFKAFPLALLIPGVLRRRVQPLQWALLLISLYIGEGALRVFEPMPASLCAAIEMALGAMFFAFAIVILRPLKMAAKRRKTRDAMAGRSTGGVGDGGGRSPDQRVEG